MDVICLLSSAAQVVHPSTGVISRYRAHQYGSGGLYLKTAQMTVSVILSRIIFTIHCFLMVLLFTHALTMTVICHKMLTVEVL